MHFGIIELICSRNIYFKKMSIAISMKNSCSRKHNWSTIMDRIFEINASFLSNSCSVPLSPRVNVDFEIAVSWISLRPKSYTELFGGEGVNSVEIPIIFETNWIETGLLDKLCLFQLVMKISRAFESFRNYLQKELFAKVLKNDSWIRSQCVVIMLCKKWIIPGNFIIGNFITLCKTSGKLNWDGDG